VYTRLAIKRRPQSAVVAVARELSSRVWAVVREIAPTTVVA
jgi:hypothetical protein